MESNTLKNFALVAAISATALAGVDDGHCSWHTNLFEV